MSKERLEDWIKDKKEQLKSATIFINENGNEAVEVSLSVLNKLVEQAERVQELEGSYNKVLGRALDIQEQNKRYREVIDRTLKEGITIKDCDEAINRIYGILGEAMEESE